MIPYTSHTMLHITAALPMETGFKGSSDIVHLIDIAAYQGCPCRLGFKGCSDILHLI